MIRLGTLFSGIGAFEHALKQLGIEHEIKFACDCGERELPLRYGDLFVLTKGMSNDMMVNYCTDYINKVGVKIEYRQVEIDLLTKILLNKDVQYKEEAPVVIKSRKVWPEGHHNLDIIAGYCGYDLKYHHHTLADAEACAVIAMQIL